VTRAIHIAAVLFLLVVALACTQQAIDHEKAPPNVLLILTDDQGIGDIGIHGNDSIETPVQNMLATEGIRMNYFYVSPVCAPTRASLLTGRYHYRTGTTWMTRNGEAMRSEEVTLAEIFKANGYATGCFGKWHNGAHYPQNPLGQGFDTFTGFSGGQWNRYHDPDLESDGKTTWFTGYITDIITEAAADFIATNSDKPFFAYLPYNAPHTPYIAPDSLFLKYRQQGVSVRNASIYGMIERIDQNLGRLLDTLESQGILENTLVIFMTDNGPNGDRYRMGLRGRKSSVSDGGVRVPCFFYWKDHLKGGRTLEELTAHIDILPTLVELLDLEPIPTLPLDGISFAPLLLGQAKSLPDRTFFTFSVNRNRYKGSVRNRTHRLTISGENEYRLTQLKEDPQEARDVKTQFPGLASALYTEYLNKYEEVTAGLEGYLPVPVGYAASPVVELPAHEGFPLGDVRYNSSPQGWNNDWFVNWTAKSDTLYWNIEVAAGGTYRAYLKYECPQEYVGSRIHVNVGTAETSALLTEAFIGETLYNHEQLSRGRVADDQTWGELDLGELELKAGPGRVLLFATDIRQGMVAETKGLRLEKL